MEIKAAATTIELALTLSKREAELLSMVMIRNITIPDMVARDNCLSVEDQRDLSNMMEEIGLALMR